MSKEKVRDNWERSVEEHKRQMDIWNELLPDGFEDAEITENITGKAPKSPTIMPPKGRSSID
jgi:hypothetical protein